MTIGKNGLLTATSVIALLFGTPVLAAGDMGKPETQRGAQMQSDSMTQRGARIQASELVGKDLRTSSGEDIGSVESVIIDREGEVAAVIVNVADFLGIGGREVALDWKDLRLAPNGEAIHTSLTEAQLRALPAYRYASPENRGTMFRDDKFLGEDTGRNEPDD